MKRKICVRSMVLGAVIMLIGLGVGAMISPPLSAQRNGVFGEIQCTKLTVVDNMGRPAVVLASSEEGNVIALAGKQGKAAIGLLSHEDVGNSLTICNKQGEEVVMLHSTEYGGRVDVLNNQAKPRATMGVNEYGNGAVSTWDRNGYRQ